MSREARHKVDWDIKLTGEHNSTDVVILVVERAPSILALTERGPLIGRKYHPSCHGDIFTSFTAAINQTSRLQSGFHCVFSSAILTKKLRAPRRGLSAPRTCTGSNQISDRNSIHKGSELFHLLPNLEMFFFCSSAMKCLPGRYSAKSESN